VYSRPQAIQLARRFREARRFIRVVAGPRQVGKTTLVQQLVQSSKLAVQFASADEPTLRGREWIEQQWEAARLTAKSPSTADAVLVLHEVQKIPNRSEVVKPLWDADTRTGAALKVVLLGSAPWLIQRGLRLSA
jgi:uncharacterized protein